MANSQHHQGSDLAFRQSVGGGDRGTIDSREVTDVNYLVDTTVRSIATAGRWHIG
jgi:hypothetical protein